MADMIYNKTIRPNLAEATSFICGVGNHNVTYLKSIVFNNIYSGNNIIAVGFSSRRAWVLLLWQVVFYNFFAGNSRNSPCWIWLVSKAFVFGRLIFLEYEPFYVDALLEMLRIWHGYKNWLQHCHSGVGFGYQFSTPFSIVFQNSCCSFIITVWSFR